MKLKSQGIQIVLFLTIASVLGTFLPKAVYAMGGVNDLVGMLTSQLGVSKEQATGGSGAVFKYAKDSLSAEDFSKVNAGLPGIDSLMSAAPEAGGLGSSLGGASAFLGGKAKSLGGLSSLSDSFSKLGLSPDMVGQFVPIILKYAQSAGGEQVMGLLKGVLG